MDTGSFQGEEEVMTSRDTIWKHSIFYNNILKRTKQKGQLGTVVHACNPSYLRGRDREDCSSMPAQAKKFVKPHLDQ
jgi:hypothetical protein